LKVESSPQIKNVCERCKKQKELFNEKICRECYLELSQGECFVEDPKDFVPKSKKDFWHRIEDLTKKFYGNKKT
jgi:predicted amidophosphoribosyltransferase